MKAGDKIITKDGMNLIAVTANGSSPCAGCFFNDGQGKPCALPERTEEALCWDENKSEFKDLVFIVEEENNRKKMKKQTWKMHFFKGVPCKWDGDRYDEERDNSVFKADLYIAGYSRGCSSAVMLLVPYKDKDKDYYSQKIKYQVFMSDIEDIVKEMVKGRIKGSFTWVKKGANYGLKLVKEAV